MYYITTKTGDEFKLLGQDANRAAARELAKTLKGTVRTEAEYLALAPKTTNFLNKGEPVVPKTWVDIAKQVKATNNKPHTIGKKEKAENKRVFTDPAVIEQARLALTSAITARTNDNGTVNKVDQVRFLALWKDAAGVKLQRRDAFVILTEGIAAATINTQWQLVRSGKFVAKK